MTPVSNGKPAPPVIRHAPLGELRVYTIHEHELEGLARGSPGSLFLNFALALLPVSITLIVTLATTTIPSIRLYVFFVCVCVISCVNGVLLLGLWWRQHTSSKKMIDQIKNRMPPPQGIQEADDW